ncbi:UbiA family prenyltransferase [Candidatus Peregrinibacteria bacterium]|nr:MAG: UbiA family prenyltransferase [Candidatus Peregrinibacteria bacterium]
MHLNEIRKLLRLEQWYKNILIVTAFLFTQNHLAPLHLALGFLGFCTLSSTTYIINDWMDREKDRHHPQKKDRPLASGKVTGLQALITGTLLLAFSLYVCTQLGSLYTFSAAIYFLGTNAYSFGLKNIPLLDIAIILLNFNLRTLAGFQAFPALNDSVYFVLLSGLVLFAITSKRKSDRAVLGEKAVAHKPVLKFYTKGLCRIIITFSYFLVCLGVFTLAMQKEERLIEALLFVLMMLYTNRCFKQKPELAIKPHYLFTNPVWILLLLTLLLLPLLG